jgi:hypothetical protein
VTPDLILSIGVLTGIGAAALMIAESVARCSDAADEERLDEESIARAIANARPLIADEISRSHGLPMDDDDVQELHRREAAEFRSITQRLDLRDGTAS